MFILMMLACQPEVECSEELACDFGSICMEGTCLEIPCATSDQCGIEQYCDERQCTDCLLYTSPSPRDS